MSIQDPKILTATSGQKAEEGIITTTLGFGQGFNEDLLIGMARATTGNFYFIQSIDEARVKERTTPGTENTESEKKRDCLNL